MSDISLHLDEDNDLSFKVTIEGSKPGDLSYRLILDTSDISYSFPGKPNSAGEVDFTVPAMKQSIREGSYPSRLEVILDDRLFIPLKFTTSMINSVKIVAESIQKVPKKIDISASITSSSHTVRKESAQKIESKVLPVQNVYKESLGELNGKPISESDIRAIFKTLINKR